MNLILALIQVIITIFPQLTGNPLFIKAMEIVNNLLHIYLRDIVAFHGNNKSIKQHEDCFHALQDRDTEKAVYIMAEHYDMLLDRMNNWLKLSEEERHSKLYPEKNGHRQD